MANVAHELTPVFVRPVCRVCVSGQLLSFDQVINKQRLEMYSIRRQVGPPCLTSQKKNDPFHLCRRPARPLRSLRKHFRTDTFSRFFLSLRIFYLCV